MIRLGCYLRQDLAVRMNGPVMKKNPHPLSESDYDAIEAAVMETERGRWFLARYAARNRNSDTAVLLDAIQKLERAMQENRAAVGPSDVEQVRFDLVEMAAAIAETKREIAALQPEQDDGRGIHAATEELDAIVTATETATQEILEAAERIQEITWTMREAGIDDSHCEAIDDLITTVYTACSFQDITGQRISKVVAVLRYLEDRLEAMRHIWGDTQQAPVAEQPTPIGDARPDSHLLNGPQLDGNGHSQEDVDIMLVPEDELFDAPAAAEDTADVEAVAEAVAEEIETRDEDPVLDEEFVIDDPLAEDNDDETDIVAPEEAETAEALVTDEPETALEAPQPENLPAAPPGDAAGAPSSTCGTGEEEAETVVLDSLSDAERLALFS